MKILQVTNKVPYPTNDGGTIACMNICKGFAQLGHEVTVLAMNTLKHNVRSKDIPSEIYKLASFHLVDVPAPINALAALKNFLFSTKPYNAIRFIDKNFEDQLTKILESTEFDVIQLEGLYVCPYIPLIRTYSNATIVYRSHNVEYEIWERTAQISSGLRRFYLKNLSNRIRRFEIQLLNSYDLLVPITERDAAILNELGNKKPLLVSPTGIDASSLVPDNKELEHPSIFHIGALDWAPNQEGLIWFLDHCWPGINKKYPRLKFYIAGRNAPTWLVDKFQLPKVVFEGEVDDAYRFMNTRSIMIVPLFSGSGMRIKIIEGMALGKSIVSTPIGAEGIGVSHGENILIASNATEFINEIAALVDNKVDHKEIGRLANEFISENFDNLAAAGKLIKFYKQNSK